MLELKISARIGRLFATRSTRVAKNFRIDPRRARGSEAAGIGVPDSIKGEALVCFCVLKKGANSDVALAAELKKNVARDLGKALAPRDVIFVRDITKTRNAKVMRRIVRAAYVGEKLGDTSALENPTAIEEIHRARKA